MSEEKKGLTGIQKIVLGGFLAMAKASIDVYMSLSEEEKKEWHKRQAMRMFNKAVKGELTEPYDEDEIEYIKENLGIESAMQ